MYSRQATAILDLQYHKSGEGNLIVKELAMMRADSWRYHHFTFSSPKPLELMDMWQSKYVTSKINGIDYDAEGLPYSYLLRVLESIERNKAIQVILVKVLEKYKFLRNYSSKVTLLSDEPAYSKMKSYRHNCPIHSPTFTCCALHHIIQHFMYF